MDQERTSFLFLLVHFVLLFPCVLSSLHGQDDSASAKNLTFHLPPSSAKNAAFDDESSLMNESLQFFSCAAVIFSLPNPKANSSLSLSAEFSFPHQRGNGLLFLSAENLLLDEPVQTAKFGPPINSEDLLLFRNRAKNPDLSAKSNLGKKDIVYGLYTPILAIMSVFSAIWSYLRRLFKKKEKTPEISPPEAPASTRDSSISNLLAGHHRFTYRELSVATRHFHSSELLGEGRYASVYRAVFRGSVVMYAVKRFNQSASSKFSFELEATAIHRLRHRKILELRGWCDENPDEPLLLYDYMHNRSLHGTLRNSFRPLPWPLRYSIAVGVAEALVYLHEDCSPPVIHSDIKEGNVMLDADFNPKLGDFGLAMSGPPYTIRRERTERDPPECQPFEEVTEKLDVYLYGSLLLALCCRRIEQPRKLYRQVQNLKMAGRLFEAADHRLNGNYNREEMVRLLNVALQCLEQKVQMRPSMTQVLRILRGEEIEEEPEPIFHIEL